jgi:DNA-binding MarR family transcriptional regulator
MLLNKEVKSLQEKDIGMLIKQLYDAKEKRANEQLKEFELTFSQFRLLIYVRERGGKAVPLKEIERHFFLTQQTVAGIMKRLEEKGFVSSCEDTADKRVKNVFLTEKGEESCRNAMDCYQRSQELLTRGLSQKEQQELSRLLTVVLGNMKL